MHMSELQWTTAREVLRLN